MNHTQIINALIKKFNYKSYLEIGVRNPNDNFYLIDIEHKESCDIEDKYNMITYHMTSDEMFNTMDQAKKYDIIFIDGMHDESYVDRDIHNSMCHLNNGGVICIHDVIPGNKRMTEKKAKYDDRTAWTGDVYKSVAKLYGTGIDYVTVNNNDYGLCIIYFNGHNNDIGKQCEYSYEDLFGDNHSMRVLTPLAHKVLNIIDETNI
jgi:hypothetical protein